MSGTRLIIKEAEITLTGILITKMSIIDSESGFELRIAKLTPGLLEFLKILEIEIDNYFEVQKMKEKNPSFTKLIETFKLYT
jgi:hypothetical protein